LAVVTVAVYWAVVQGHHGRAGVDHEVDALAVDMAFGCEMAAGVAGDAERAQRRRDWRLGHSLPRAAGGSRRRRHLVGHLRHKDAKSGHDRRGDNNVTHDATLARTPLGAISPRQPGQDD
jgi:hypothetical protein